MSKGSADWQGKATCCVIQKSVCPAWTNNLLGDIRSEETGLLSVQLVQPSLACTQPWNDGKTKNDVDVCARENADAALAGRPK